MQPTLCSTYWSWGCMVHSMVLGNIGEEKSEGRGLFDSWKLPKCKFSYARCVGDSPIRGLAYKFIAHSRRVRSTPSAAPAAATTSSSSPLPLPLVVPSSSPASVVIASKAQFLAQGAKIFIINAALAIRRVCIRFGLSHPATPAANFG